MSSSTFPRFSRLAAVRPAAFVWIGALVLAVFFVTREVRQYLVWTPQSYGPYWPHRTWLFAHLATGTLVLAAGLLQFVSRIRAASPQVHRWIGRVYVGGVVLTAASAFYLAQNTVVGWMVSVMLTTLAALWVAATAMAVAAIRQGNIGAHREWMVRSYVLVFAFVLVRILLLTPLFADVAFHERLATLGWLSWTVPLFLAELALQWRRSVARARPLR
jgi:uncharacterized membrane protein